jgi:hypothetical protein
VRAKNPYAPAEIPCGLDTQVGFSKPSGSHSLGRK